MALKWDTWAYNTRSRVITLLVTGRGPLCDLLAHFGHSILYTRFHSVPRSSMWCVCAIAYPKGIWKPWSLGWSVSVFLIYHVYSYRRNLWNIRLHGLTQCFTIFLDVKKPSESCDGGSILRYTNIHHSTFGWLMVLPKASNMNLDPKSLFMSIVHERISLAMALHSSYRFRNAAMPYFSGGFCWC